MIRADKVVSDETKYITFFSVGLSVIMQISFLLLRKWDYTVLLGNILSLMVSVLNFYFMGITVQEAVSKEESEARKLMRTSQSLRNIFMFVSIMIGVLIPVFNTVAIVLTVFFPRIAVSFRPLFERKGSDINE